MKITRRDALRQCLIITVGATLIPSCMQEKEKPLADLKHIDLNGNNQKLITELCETIIPATDTPGAKDTYTHLFVLKMLDDCSTKEEQDAYVRGLKDFEDFSKKKFDKSFTECTVQQREDLLRSVIDNKGKDISKETVDFLNTTKKLTLQGFMTSKYYLTNVRVYKLVPGKFSGCFPVTKFNKQGSI